MAEQAEYKEGSSRHLCMGCMCEKDGEGPCNRCGYSGTGPANADYLPPGTHLGGRYLVGKMLGSNGESAVYIGYDLMEEAKVYIRELMPQRLVRRNHSNMHLKPVPGSEAVYKGIAAEFEDMFTILRGMTARNVTQVTDLLHENNTVYAVCRFLNTMPLAELIAQCGGEIPWGKSKKMFLSLLNTLSQVHKKGLIHAGISPQTILVDDKGTPYLSAFSTYASRARDSEIDCELFDGYSAPEQYVNTHQFGEWTDIYALCAVIYRTITGTKPPDAQDRRSKDNLVDASQLDGSIPPNVSDTIRDGMCLQTAQRVQTADQLSARLLDNVESNTVLYVTEPAGGEPGPAKAPPGAENIGGKKRRKRRGGFIFLCVFVPMVLTAALLGGLIWYMMNYRYVDIFRSVSGSSSETSPASDPIPTASEAPDIPAVPNFIGQYIDTVTSNEEYARNFDITTKYAYNDLYPAGVVFDQSPAEGTQMANRGTVILSVSQGSDTVKVPDLAGSSLERAKKDLTDMGLTYKVIFVANDNYTEGIVASSDPPAGSNVKRGEEILLFTRDEKKADVSSESASSEESSSEASSKKASSSSKASSTRKSSSSSRDREDD